MSSISPYSVKRDILLLPDGDLLFRSVLLVDGRPVISCWGEDELTFQDLLGLYRRNPPSDETRWTLVPEVKATGLAGAGPRRVVIHPDQLTNPPHPL